MSSNLSWHNENKGMFMINTEHKSSVDFNKLLLKYGEDLVLNYDVEDEVLLQTKA